MYNRILEKDNSVDKILELLSNAGKKEINMLCMMQWSITNMNESESLRTALSEKLSNSTTTFVINHYIKKYRNYLTENDYI